MGVRKENFPVRIEKLAGGTGAVEISHLLTNDEFYGAGRMFSRVVLKPGCSIGWHEHKDEVEYYYILTDSLPIPIKRFPRSGREMSAPCFPTRAMPLPIPAMRSWCLWH